MSWKGMGFLVAVVVLLAPTAVLADGVDFSISGGTISVGAGPAFTNSGNPSTLTVVAGFPSGISIASTNLGTAGITTGVWSGNSNTADFFAPGGSISITSAPVAALTGGSSALFSGAFSGIQVADFSVLSPGCNLNDFSTYGLCNAFSLSGKISGSVDPSLVSYLGLSSSPTSGYLLVLNVDFSSSGWGIVSGDILLDPVNVPEPGTLALLGTGLLGLAGLVRRKIAA